MSSAPLIYHCQFFGCRRELVKQHPSGTPPKYCAEHRKEVRRMRARIEKRRRRQSMVGVVCHGCKGRITKPHKKFFCSEYCAWIGMLCRKSKRVARQVREFKLSRFLEKSKTEVLLCRG